MVHVLVALADTPSWARAVVGLPAHGQLALRTVLVPSERHAHALRRELTRSGQGAVLAGTRFVSPLTAATEVLRRAGASFATGEEILRPARLLALFREDLPLEHFDLTLLRSRPGWDQAFASAITNLEGGGLSPSTLPRDSARMRDLGLMWKRVDAAANSSFTSARIYLEASTLLSRDPRAWFFDGPTLVAITGHEDAAMARFIRALPRVTLGMWTARPVQGRHRTRTEMLFGPEAARALGDESLTSTQRSQEARYPQEAGTERDLLAAYLFRSPEVLAAPTRPHSQCPDGTVHLEQHASVDSELRATTDWAASKVLEEGLGLEEIAILLPALDPLAGLVADRLAELPFEGGVFPVHIAGGIPALSLTAGTRVLAVLRALRAHLSADTLGLVLPALRLVGEEGRHLSAREAMELAFALGTVGGNAAHPEGALEWTSRATARMAELEVALKHAQLEQDSAAREVRRLEGMLRNLRAVWPALAALVEVARCLVSGGRLTALWDELGGFLGSWLPVPGEGTALVAGLRESLAPACRGDLGKSITGHDALVVVEDHLRRMRVGRERFGAPAVYVGTVASAAGLDFGAVRVLGLCEGALPSLPREDPVLPEQVVRDLEATVGCVLDSPEDMVAAQMTGFYAAVRAARRSLVLSAPRQDLERTEREPAAIFIEAAAALRRPGVSGMAALRQSAFGPARRSGQFGRPVTEANWLDRAARVLAELPPTWTNDPVLSLDRIDELQRPSGPLGPADGMLGSGPPFPPVPGLDPDHPISASALQQLVECPRQFLMRRVLHWEEPVGPPSLREIDAAPYGSLLHRVMESFYRVHGTEVVARQRSFAYWHEVLLRIADQLFEEFLSEYPLVGIGLREKERERLHQSLGAFLRYDWAGSLEKAFVGVELPFGDKAPLAVSASGNTLFVRGYIDRVDVEGGYTLVRDLKSGRPYPRAGEESGPTPVRDIQLGLYQLAAKKLARIWGTPARVLAAYVYASGRGEVEERAFREDPDALGKATEVWLAAAGQLLTARAFAPTPVEEDCRYCPFRPLCGSEVPGRAAKALEEAAEGPLALLRSLKLSGEEDSE